MTKYIITQEGKTPFGYASLEEAEDVAQKRQGNSIVWELKPVSATNREMVLTKLINMEN